MQSGTKGVAVPLTALGAAEEGDDDGAAGLAAQNAAAGVDDATREVVNHLLWHKALSDEPEEAERLDEYLRLMAHSERGEHHTIQDPFHRAVALAFELVLQEHLDPWRIDLAQFSRVYLERAREAEIDLVLSGRIILMAWTVLKLQSDAMVELADRLANPPAEPEPDFLDWADIGDWNYDDEDLEYTRRVTHATDAPLDEKIRRQGDSRKVTLMELVDAFEEVRHEAEERQRTRAERERTRALLRQQADDSVSGMMHAEDPEAEQQSLWGRILGLNGNAIPLRELHDPEIDSFVTTFNSVLFMANDRRIRLWQEEFPHGDILLKNREHVDSEEEAAEEAELVWEDEPEARRVGRRMRKEESG